MSGHALVLYDHMCPEQDWSNLLYSIKNYVRSMVCSTPHPTKGFISYAWEPDKIQNKILQDWITRLRADLLKCALDEVFFDIYNMHGDMEVTMRTNIEATDAVFFICNPKFKSRVSEPGQRPGGKSNLAFEVDNVLAAQLRGPIKILPLLQSHTQNESIPDSLNSFTFFPFNREELYHKYVTGFMSIEGLIPALCDIPQHDDVYQKLLYQHYVHHIEGWPLNV